MRLNAPSRAVWLIALIVGGFGILLRLGVLSLRLGIDSFWLVVAGFVLLLVATAMRGL
ncbi:MAG TPA: hypothetical protein VGL15_16630 [Vicinamibacteria bacterium]|jgi:hypothetical protein